ncbi:MAG: formylglycine-generating enzyme family protein [Pirellulaceae bacterium]|nr:formylglycine-generating enzyme family protein [Pirellulaceae bacterium]
MSNSLAGHLNQGRTNVGRADLVRVIGAEDEGAVRFVAQRLGLSERFVPLESPAPFPAAWSAGPLPEVSDAAWPDQQAPAAFWRPIHFELRDAEAIRRRAQPDDAVPAYNTWRDRPTDVPAIQPLATWSQLVPRLRQGLACGSRNSRIDIRKLVRQVARRQVVLKLPRRRVRRWGSSVLVMVDYSQRLIPFRHDQELVCGYLRRLLPPGALRLAVCSDPEQGLTEWCQTDKPASVQPQPGSVVLVLGDLGALDARDSDCERTWLRWGRVARRSGSRLIALVPCVEALVAEPLRQVYSVHAWQRLRAEDCSPQSLAEQVESLLRVAAVAVRLEPGLLRAMRGLSAQWADAALESLLWQHNAVRSRHPSAATFDPQSARELLEQFERLDQQLKQGVLKLVRHWHAAPGLDHSVWLDEVRRLAAETRKLIPSGDVDDALAQGTFLLQRSRAAASLDGSTLAFMHRSVERQSHAGWSDETLGPIYRQLAEVTHPDVDPTTLPEADPAEQPPGDALLQVEIHQRGDRLCFLQVPSGVAERSASGRGSLCGRLATTNELLLLDRTAGRVANQGPNRAGLWKEGVPPRWASDWGRDEFGAWADLRIAAGQSPDETPIVQRLRWIPPGTFLMGSPEDEPGRWDDEGPRHQVTMSRGFWLFDTAVTQELWQAVATASPVVSPTLNANPSRFLGPRRPVEMVSWEDCQQFLEKLRVLVGAAFDLPTEAQWEYACRAETATPFSCGDNVTPEQVNYDGDDPYADGETGLYRQETVHVGSLPANPWGLYEIHGNVWEWCRDGLRRYSSEPAVDPVGPVSAGTERVIRGGGWLNHARYARSAYRYWFPPDYRHADLGFRCALIQAEQEAEPEQVPDQEQDPRAASSGLRAERGPVELPSGTGERRIARLDEAPDCSLRGISDLRVVTDVEQLDFERFVRPPWASAMGRDRYGLWAEFTLESPTEAELPASRPQGSRRARSKRDGKSPTEKQPAPANPITQRLRWIPPGRFRMGSNAAGDSLVRTTSPAHEVIITHGFWLFDTPVRQALWKAVVETEPSRFPGPNRPVEQVSWEHCQEFLQRLAGRVFGLQQLEPVLPTEAQWEYACRAGKQTAYAFGDSLSQSLARYNVSSDLGTIDVGSYAANDWGLYDMHGNVWEWCQDGPREYTADLARDPLGPTAAGAERVVRGGSWIDVARYARSAYRHASQPGFRCDYLGFRCALVQAR